MIVLLATATFFSSILYAASKYTYKSCNRVPKISSLAILVATLALLYIPREINECVDVAIDDHVELSFLLVTSEIARVVYGAPTDTLIPGITAMHILAYFARKPSGACNTTQFGAAISIVLVCIALEARRNETHVKQLILSDDNDDDRADDKDAQPPFAPQSVLQRDTQLVF